MRARFIFVGLCLATAHAAPAAAGPLAMAPHRASYDLSLAKTGGAKGVESARGRIVFEFTGSACEGYALTFRQVTELTGGDIGSRLSDMRTTTFEEGDGRTFRFNTESRMGQGPAEATDGTAEKNADGISVRLKKPQPGRATLKGDIAFPTAQMRMLIEAARAGASTSAVKLFDGSEGGKKVYDTFSVIGKPVPHERDGELEQPLRDAGWDKLARWPVSVSYFEEGTQDSQRPVYTLSFELLENGVSRKLRLDYGDFSLSGDLKRLDVMKAQDCPQ
ncbi:cell envelope integrity EipB family protein [Alsobacter sp. SYSU BS001988]